MNAKLIWKKYIKFSRRMSNTILLNGLYFIGIGTYSVIGRILKKRFLNLQTRRSTWTNVNQDSDWEKMF